MAGPVTVDYFAVREHNVMSNICSDSAGRLQLEIVLLLTYVNFLPIIHLEHGRCTPAQMH